VQPRRSDSLAISIDIAPTLLAAIERKATPEMQGINLLDATATSSRTAVFGECFTHESQNLEDPAASVRWRWMIEGDWKLIVPDPKNEPHDKVELYHLKDDPHEAQNLAAEHMEKVATMRERVDEWWRAGG
jgi:uncharacterized sulfatase